MFDFLFNPKGRISRKGYLIAFLVPYLLLTQIAPFIFIGTPIAGLLVLVSLFYLWPKYISVPIRRFHDMGVTGAYQLGFIALYFMAAFITVQGLFSQIGDPEVFAAMNMDQRMEAMQAATESNPRAALGMFLILGIEIAQMLLFGLMKGNTGPNQYGNDPLDDWRGFAD